MTAKPEYTHDQLDHGPALKKGARYRVVRAQEWTKPADGYQVGCVFVATGSEQRYHDRDLDYVIGEGSWCRQVVCVDALPVIKERDSLVEQLDRAAERVIEWPDWKRTMFDRLLAAEEYFSQDAGDALPTPATEVEAQPVKPEYSTDPVILAIQLDKAERAARAELASMRKHLDAIAVALHPYWHDHVGPYVPEQLPGMVRALQQYVRAENARLTAELSESSAANRGLREVRGKLNAELANVHKRSAKAVAILEEITHDGKNWERVILALDALRESGAKEMRSSSLESLAALSKSVCLLADVVVRELSTLERFR